MPTWLLLARKGPVVESPSKGVQGPGTGSGGALDGYSIQSLLHAASPAAGADSQQAARTELRGARMCSCSVQLIVFGMLFTQFMRRGMVSEDPTQKAPLGLGQENVLVGLGLVREDLISD